MSKCQTTTTVVEIPFGEDEGKLSPGPPSEMVHVNLVQALRPTVDERGDQLSVPQTNRPEKLELSIPREIISSSVASSTLQSELMRPIFAGTYRNTQAYLVGLQFQLLVHSPGWLSRIKSANINVVVNDAALRDDAQDKSTDMDAPHPSIVKCFPGPSGWEGQPTAAEVTETVDVGMDVPLDPVGISANVGQSRKRAETGAVKVMTVRKGHQRDNLTVTVVEDFVDAAGTPQYRTIPFIITHHNRSFSMRVSLNARYGCWRGKLAEMVPVLGRADEPLYFDPSVMERIMKTVQKGTDCAKIVEWKGGLEGNDLRDH